MKWINHSIFTHNIIWICWNKRNWERPARTYCSQQPKKDWRVKFVNPNWFDREAISNFLVLLIENKVKRRADRGRGRESESVVDTSAVSEAIKTICCEWYCPKSSPTYQTKGRKKKRSEQMYRCCQNDCLFVSIFTWLTPDRHSYSWLQEQFSR